MTNLLTEGTEGRTSRQIADDVARLGATLNAGANSDFTTVAASALSKYTNEIFELLADVTLRPSFPEEELTLAKENTKQGLIQQRSQPSFLASEQVARAVFGQHPYAEISASPESIDATTRESLVRFHSEIFRPNQGVLLAVGDIDFEEFRASAEKMFGAWVPKENLRVDFPALPEASSRRAFVVDRAGSEQSNIVIANPAIKRTDRDFFPMLVLHTVLGANASSRLFMNLREAKGYTYGAYSTLDARTYAGSFRVSAEVRTAVTGASLTEFFSELERIRNENVADNELRDAKAYLTGVFPLRLETQEGLIDQLVQMKMFGLTNDYLQTYRENVQAVTIEDIRRVAERHITPDAAAIVIVGDASAIIEEVRNFSDDIELYDSQGRKKIGETTLGTNDENFTDITGSWNLELTLPTGQKVPATLTIEYAELGYTGKVSSKFGDAQLSNIVVDDNNLQAAVSLSLMGQTMAADVAAVVDGNIIRGSFNIPGFPQIHLEGQRTA
jgi:zinc protease